MSDDDNVKAQAAAPDGTGQIKSPAPMQVPDEVLVLQLRDGQPMAGQQLAQRHFRGLMRYLQRLVASDQLAEELHQQTWASVLEHLDRFDPAIGGGFKAWLYRIATNKAKDHWRSRGREKGAHAGLRLITEEAGPEASFRLESSEQEAKLQKAIAALPENQRQVLLMRYYANMKFVDIAQSLGCPLNTALGRMHKAMQRLKQLMS